MPTLTLTFPTVSPAPPNGFRVKYWPTDNPTNITEVSPNPISSPININVTDYDYTGTIEPSCGGGVYGAPVPFTVSLSVVCFQYINNSGIAWMGDWKDCGGTWHYNEMIGPSQFACAAEDTVFTLTGVDLTKGPACT